MPSMASDCLGGNAILPIRFFKIILKINLQRLKLPNKFAKRFGGDLPNPVFMKPPDGTEWRVYWIKQNEDEVWFQTGWKEFVEHYSLDEGHVVFFTYEGTCHINIHIHDKTSLEIDYPCDEKVKLDNSDDESLIILDQWPEKNAKQTTDQNALQRISLNCPKDARAEELARKFMSCNPFFTIFLKPYNVSRSKLPIPNLTGYIENRNKFVMLLSGKRSWTVKLLDFKLFGSGWLKFARETELQPRDIIIFELICTKKSVFKVHVFKSQS